MYIPPRNGKYFSTLKRLESIAKDNVNSSDARPLYIAAQSNGKYKYRTKLKLWLYILFNSHDTDIENPCGSMEYALL